MGNSACAKRHLDVVDDFVFSFLQKYTVKCLDKEDGDSQGHSKYISIEKMSKPMKEHFLLVLENGKQCMC